MGLAKELARARALTPVSCPVAGIGPDVDTALVDRSLPSALLAAALCNAGHFVSAQDVRDHRADDCACIVRSTR